MYVCTHIACFSPQSIYNIDPNNFALTHNSLFPHLVDTSPIPSSHYLL